ncbi:MAG: hypothetical protein ABEJ56_01750 [Candidatus Nanohaloarchaea archaeon]
MSKIFEEMTGYQLMIVWGAAVVAGWLGSQILASTGYFGANTVLAITTLWLIGALIPVIASYLWTRENDFEWILAIWPAVGVAGILATYAVALNYLTVNPMHMYGTFWFVAPAVGFLATVYYVDDWSRNLYLGAALLNLGGAYALLQVPSFATYYYTFAAVAQGVPMLVHGYRG